MIPPGLELEPDSFMSEEDPTGSTARTKNPAGEAGARAPSTVELTNLHRGDDNDNDNDDDKSKEELASPVNPMMTTTTTTTSGIIGNDPASLFVPRRHPEPVLVETVVSEAEDSIMKKQQQQEHSAVDNKKDDDLQIIVIDIFPQNTQAAIRCTMTLLAACLVPAACLTLLGAMQSHTATGFLFLVLVWAVLLVLFGGLVWILQKVILEHDPQQRNAQVFHPYIHAVADMIVQEYNDFKEDWKYEYLLMLEDGPTAAMEENEYVRMGEENATVAEKDQQQTGRGRKPKSAIFRNIVKPIIRPLFSRRRQRRRKRELQRQQEAVVVAAAAENYVPAKV